MTRRTWLTFAVALVSLTGGVAYSLGSPAEQAGPGPGLPRYAKPPELLQTADREQTRTFGALAEPGSGSDRLPAAARRVIADEAGGEFGVNPQLARSVGASDFARRGFLVPGQKVLCLVEGSGIITCNATEAVALGQLTLSLDAGTGSELLGVVPDGIHSVSVTLASGRVESLAVTENGYEGRFDEPLVEVAYTSPEGETQAVTAASP